MISVNSLEEEMDMISQINAEQLTLYKRLSGDDGENEMVQGRGGE